MKKVNNKAIVVLGMHRSGTSAVTGTLARCGVQLGSRLYAPQADINAKGYFEHSDIADINDELLFKLGSSWDDILPLPSDWWNCHGVSAYRKSIEACLARDFSRSDLWGLKDPRICRLLPLWKDVLKEFADERAFILSIRHPDEVAKSLQKRDSFSRDKSLILWLSHTLDAEYWTREESRSILLFDRLLDDPIEQVNRLQTSLDLDFPANMEDAKKSVLEFITSSLRHQVHDGFEGKDPLSEIECLCRDAYDEIRYADTSIDRELDVGKLDQLRSRFVRYIDSFPSVLVEHSRRTSMERGKLQVLVNRIFQSRSWYLGKPLRYLERLLGGRT